MAVTVELRSVNHRYADFFLRIPREIHSFEERIRRLLKKEVLRGRVEVNVTLTGSPAGEEAVALNKELAAAYYRVLEGLADHLYIPMSLGVEDLIQLPGVLQDSGAAPQGEELCWPFLEKALQEALESLVKFRNEEGDNLARDLKLRLDRIAAMVEELAAFAPRVLEEQQLRLKRRLTEMLGGHFDENRILMECAVLAERMDIHEEVIRLRSHIESFGGALCGDGPAGRRLDFVAQELFREINTVGAKSQDYRIAKLVVEIKTELEKMREQIQNIE